MNLNKVIPIILFFLFGLQHAYSQPDHSWAIQGGKTSLVEGNIEVVNTTSGMVIAGDFLETAQFGDQQITSNGYSDIYLANFDDSGELEQIISFGNENEEFLKFLVVDNEGNIIISIIFTDAITIDGTDYTSYGGQDIMLLKFNSDFDLLWVKHYGTGLTDYIKGMDIDAEDNIVITGKFKNDLAFDDMVLSSAGSTDIYVVKYNPEGEVVVALAEGGSAYEDANTIASGNEGSFFLSGTFYESTIINGQTISTDHTTGIFIAKYDPYGIFQWVEVLDGTNLLPYLFITTNMDGSIYIAGSFQDIVNFGTETLITEEFDVDVFIAKYDSYGEAQWAAHGNSEAGENITALSSDIGGNVYVTGPFLATIDFDGQIIEYTLC
jgi:hypothetical protein